MTPRTIGSLARTGKTFKVSWKVLLKSWKFFRHDIGNSVLVDLQFWAKWGQKVKVKVTARSCVLNKAEAYASTAPCQVCLVCFSLSFGFVTASCRLTVWNWCLLCFARDLYVTYVHLCWFFWTVRLNCDVFVFVSFLSLLHRLCVVAFALLICIDMCYLHASVCHL